MIHKVLYKKESRLSRCLFITTICAGVFSIVLGIIVLTGWHTDNETLIQVLPLFVPMQYNTALGFVLCGACMFLEMFRKQYSTVTIGALLIVIGSLTLLEYLIGQNLGIDELLMKHYITVKTSHPGRMAPNTALCFALIGLSLLSSILFKKQIYQSLLKAILASLVFGLGVVAIFGYLIQLVPAYGWGNLTQMAIHTSLGFIAISIGLLTYIWRKDIISKTTFPKWFPVPITIGTLTVTICLWQANLSVHYSIVGHNVISTTSSPSTAILITGVLFSFILGLVILLAQNSIRRAQEIVKTNQTLEEEVTERKLAEAEIIRQRDISNAITKVFREALTCETEEMVGYKCLSVAEKLTGSKFGFIDELNEKTGLFDTIALSNPGWEECEIPNSKAAKLLKDMKICAIDRSTLREEKSRIVNDPASHPDRVRTPNGLPQITAFLGVPLNHNGRTFGMIGLANKESGYDLKDQQAIEALSVVFVEAIIRRRMELDLKESEEKFRIMCTSANDAIIMLDDEGKVSYWNETADKTFGYSAEEIIGKGLHELIVPMRYRKSMLHGLKEFLNTGHGPLIGKNVELIAMKRDGTEFPIEHSVSAVNMKGKWHSIGIIRDITERKQMEKNVMESNKMASLGRLTAGVSHEILNPLNIISAYTQLMLLKKEKDSDRETYLKKILEEVDRIVKITDNLLSFSRNGDLKVDNVIISSLLKKTISIVKPEMELKNIKLLTKFERNSPKVLANEDQLRQVFLNFIMNSNDAMPEGGNLTISTQRIEMRGKPFIRILFKDTGHGISKENLDHVFDPFFTTKKESKGTGLGLSISYGIIKSHKGEISVNSKEGKETTFIVDLPANT